MKPLWSLEGWLSGILKYYVVEIKYCFPSLKVLLKYQVFPFSAVGCGMGTNFLPMEK